MTFDKTDYYPVEGMLIDDIALEDNCIISGISLAELCVHIVEQYGFESEILSASLRNPRQVSESALAGAHIETLP